MNRRLLILTATVASTSVATLLLALKGWGWMQSDSLSLFASLMDSVLDVVVSLVNLLAARYALQPADDEHRFGHAAAEDLAALFQAAFMSASALWILLEAGQRLLYPDPLHSATAGLWVSATSLALTLLLVLYQRWVIRQTQSLVVESDHLHYAGDLLMNGSVLIALALQQYAGWVRADSLFAIGIAVYVGVAAWKIGRRAFRHLMDAEMPEADKEQIRACIAAVRELQGVHAFKTRISGNKRFVQLHAELPGDLPLWQAHAIIDRLEKAIAGCFEEVEVIIHPDPK